MKNTQNKPLRILQIVPNLCVVNGITAVVMLWYKNIDRQKIQFDFLSLYKAEPSFEAEIKNMGGNVFYMPDVKNIFGFIARAAKVFGEGKYNIIHSHITQFNLFFFPIAKFYGVKNIILHSHATRYSEQFFKDIINRLMLLPVRFFVTLRLACAKGAGSFMFGAKPHKVVYNGIDLNKFAFNNQARLQMRRALGLDNNFVIAHLGRFSKTKNHTFLLKVFSRILQKDATAVLLLAGEGPLLEKVKEEAFNAGLSSSVMFLGSRSDAPALYSAADAFVLPSFHEGLPVSLLEAQAAALPCFVSDNVTKEAAFNNTSFLPLSIGAEGWAEEILKASSACSQCRILSPALLLNIPFSASCSAAAMESIYLKL